MKRDFHDIILISEAPEDHKAALFGALKQMEENGVIRSCEFEGKTYYILNKPIDSYEQNVTIHSTTAANIGIEINEACEMIEDDSDYCDYTNITENDIANLVNIIRIHKNGKEEI